MELQRPNGHQTIHFVVGDSMSLCKSCLPERDSGKIWTWHSKSYYGQRWKCTCSFDLENTYARFKTGQDVPFIQCRCRPFHSSNVVVPRSS